MWYRVLPRASGPVSVAGCRQATANIVGVETIPGRIPGSVYTTKEKCDGEVYRQKGAGQHELSVVKTQAASQIVWGSKRIGRAMHGSARRHAVPGKLGQAPLT